MKNLNVSYYKGMKSKLETEKKKVKVMVTEWGSHGVEGGCRVSRTQGDNRGLNRTC